MIGRLKYPGQSENANQYGGALTPDEVRSVRTAAVQTSGSGSGPLFARRIYTSVKRRYDLIWYALTPTEAASMIRQWRERGQGVMPSYLIPGDRSEPLTVVFVGSPSLTYGSSALVSLRMQVEEQR